MATESLSMRLSQTLNVTRIIQRMRASNHRSNPVHLFMH